ncbi:MULTISPECIES: RagB/SusD family nutrient uptake outer membrane protein [Petrimonas]|jgi:tetratricopeptide (TPR) repeat protein|uniref:RagB/SusD family nutrient uptake outer membrane protein n=1 Tax=Petrimonas TaxID=307628 RepID=UPI0008E5D7C9|nr:MULTISPECIES: RagB/SusD family nutrient uptake outer membrane protein [Petrimonas]MDD3561727.1 RagB/SusD family nutrient uptake outer membrane protein [Petrimonas mucosa]SFU45763.1 SusD family protein [Porphyromonadaceae bacterium KHP3R9]HHT29317.1 RagB/SusD family nutrient uptake outer membrane protein [Petrimonas mucosa]
MRTIDLKYYRFFLLLPLFIGCSDFTDITPKGQSILNKVEELELLLNDEYTQLQSWEAMYLVNDNIPAQNILDLITRHENGMPTVESVLLTWDETVDRTTITQDPQQNLYGAFYGVIGRIANPIIANVDQATGSKTKAAQIKAEAYVLRAFFHYLAVNFYARAYNPATAAGDGGVPYMLEDFPINGLAEKRTVQEVYQFILEDLESALELDALPENPAGMRVGKAFAYAVKAKVLMAMRDYAGADQAAIASLAINDRLLDHRDDRLAIPMPPFDIPFFERPRFNEEELFYQVSSFTMRYIFSPDLLASFDPNDLMLKYGELENNVATYLTGGVLLNQGGNMTSLAGVQAWFHYVMAGDFKIHYSINSLTTADMYLTRAECLLRGEDANIPAAMEILEKLRERRIDPAGYTPLNVSTKTEAIAALKQVARCENFATSKNFIDMKRWNATEPEWQTTLTKTLTLAPQGFMPRGGNPMIGWDPIPPVTTKSYTLRPDSPLWIFPFPQAATNYNPNLTQNYD